MNQASKEAILNVLWLNQDTCFLTISILKPIKTTKTIRTVVILVHNFSSFFVFCKTLILEHLCVIQRQCTTRNRVVLTYTLNIHVDMM